MRYYKHICDNIENVENYEKALADDFKGWICHHRLETHNSDGERRKVDLLAKELVALDMYYHRPAEELIFLTKKEHDCLHFKGKSTWNKGKHLSEETKRKMSEAKKGKSAYWNIGRHHSEEARKKISETSKGKHLSKETRRKMSEAKKGNQHRKGMHISEETKKKMSKSHKGMHISEETKRKMSEAKKGRHWYNNGTKNIWSKTCPEGFVPGRLKK